MENKLSHMNLMLYNNSMKIIKAESEDDSPLWEADKDFPSLDPRV
jgi:hypothetical protein